MTTSLADGRRKEIVVVFLAATISFCGDWLTTVALPVLLYAKTGRADAPVLFIVCRSAPRLIGPVTGGLIADRLPAPRALSGIMAIQALITVALLGAATHAVIPAIYVCVVLSQLVGSSTRPIQQALLPDLVPPDAMRQVAAAFGTAAGASILIAPALGVLLLRAGGPTLLIELDLGTFVVAAALMLTVRSAVRAHPAAPGTLIGEALGGVPVVLADPVLRAIAGAYLGSTFLIGAVQSSFVLMASDRLGGAEVSGLLYAAVGLASVLGGTWLTVRGSGPATRVNVFLATAIAVLPLGALAAVYSLPGALALLMLGTLGSITIDAWAPAEIAHRVPHAMLGRANGVIVLGNFGGTLIGALLALVLIPTVGWPATLIVCALAGITITYVATVLPVGPATAMLPRSDEAVAVPAGPETL